MDSKKNEPIRLSEVETEMLTKALAEAQAQAEGPGTGESDTQLFRRTQVRPPKASPAPQQDQITGSTAVV